jgi:hypothetical protein
MGAFGEVTLKDATSLTVTTVGTPSAPVKIDGDWVYVWGDLPEDTALNVAGDTFTLTGSKADSGAVASKDNDTYTFSPTKELGGIVTHEVIGGGDVLNATSPSVRFYVRKSAMDNDTGKAIFNYYTFNANTWKTADDSMDVVFKNDGKVAISGADIGIWYPTAAGVTVEYTDGSKDNVTVTDKNITLNYYGSTFTAK